MTETLAAQPINEILNAVGVQRIIAIDDSYAERAPVADVIIALNSVSPEVASMVLTGFEDVDFAGDIEVRDDEIRERWPSLTSERRVQILDELRSKNSEIDDTDKITKDDLESLFGERSFQALSFTEWTQRKEEIIKDKSLALLLIDEDFSKEDMSTTQGLEIAKEVLATTSAANILCVLLSHKYLRENIHSQWEQLCKAQGFDKSRFVLIPKAVIDEDPATFARLIKLATIAKPIDSLRSEMTQIVLSAFKEASQQLEEIDIYDMDEIVFGSSWKEGIWEPETLLRVFALFHRKHTRQLSLNNAELHRIASSVRRVSRVDTTSEKQPPHRIWPIQRLEIYDDADYINSLHLPICLGDIFKRDGGKEYILVAPPCDLMVRNKGKRGIEEGILAPIITDVPEERKSVCWELAYYDQQSTSYADFKRAFSVKLSGLDLCVFNADGMATLTLKQVAAGMLIPSWEERYKVLQEEWQRALSEIQLANTNADGRGYRERALTTIDHRRAFAPSIQYATGTLNYNFKRSGRLLPPRSNALLTSYAQFLGRSAFDHSLERTARN